MQFISRRNGNKPSLETIITDHSIRDRILSDYYYHIILYDDSDIGKDSFGLYVARCLQDEAGIKIVNYLEGMFETNFRGTIHITLYNQSINHSCIGGFTLFKKQYPLLCTNSLPKPVYISSIVNKSKRPNSQYIYTWPFKSKSTLTCKPLTPRNIQICDNLSNLVVEDNSEPAELLPFLYLGSEFHASSKSTLLKLGITAILNVSHNCPNYFEDLFYYKRIGIKDSKHDDITMVIQEGLDFIGKIL